MLKWVTLMACHGGGEGPMIRYTPEFFESLENKIIVIKDFLYVCMDYTSDPYMTLLAGMYWVNLSKNSNFGFFFFWHPKLIV